MAGCRLPALAVSLLLAAAVLAQPASAGSGGDAGVVAFSDLGTWIDLYDPAFAAADPEATAESIASKGVSTLYLETGNYRRQASPLTLGRLLEAAHGQGLSVVAWYLPSFAEPGRDLRRALAATRFVSPAGDEFDAFALDIESTVVRRTSFRSARLLRLSTALRAAVGPSYPLGAIIPAPAAMELARSYWPGFPYARLAGLFDVFLPMAYYTFHVHGAESVRAYIARSVSIIRSRTRDPQVPIHVIGGLGAATRSVDTRGFLRAVSDCGVVGYSLYDFFSTRPSGWAELTAPNLAPSVVPAPCA